MPDGAFISLSQLLAARDDRAARQRNLLQVYGGALVCLTVNMPGPVKRCALADSLFEHGFQAVDSALAGRVVFNELCRKETGCEAFWCVSAPAAEIKTLLCRLENDHPLGRLWDIDVLNTDGVPISRQSVGYPPRTCLLCGNDGVACARSRAHPLPELIAEMQRRLDTYEARHDG